jgi:hypothetical protein
VADRHNEGGAVTVGDGVGARGQTSRNRCRRWNSGLAGDERRLGGDAGLSGWAGRHAGLDWRLTGDNTERIGHAGVQGLQVRVGDGG